MAFTFQGFPPPGGPPSMVYPTTATTTPGTAHNRDQDGSSLDHSNGSFGMVFAVLAIILVISIVACVMGRFCSRKAHNNKSHQIKAHNSSHNHNHNHNPSLSHSHSHMHGGPHLKDRDLEFGVRSKEGDIMLGFEPKTRVVPTAKVANHGGFRGDNGFGKGRGMEHNGMPRDFP